MARTPFDQSSYDFSDYASKIAERTIYADYVAKHYPRASTWRVIDNGMTPDDAERGIDRTLVLTFDAGRPEERTERITLQERFRRAKYANHRQLTVTEANHMSGEKGDFHKLEADLYVYGYLSDNLTWIEAVVVDVPSLKRLYRTEAVVPARAFYQRKAQTILGFPFDKLEQGGAVLWHSRSLNR